MIVPRAEYADTSFAHFLWEYSVNHTCVMRSLRPLWTLCPGRTFTSVAPLTSIQSVFWEENRILGLGSWADPSLLSPSPRARLTRCVRASAGPRPGVTRGRRSQPIRLELAEGGAFSPPGCKAGKIQPGSHTKDRALPRTLW